VGYTGTKGSNLDVLRAPNRGPNGLSIAGVAPFVWESSEGDSIMHALTLRLRKRLTNGVALGGTYTLSRSIDDASAIGGAGGTVAQNDLDLAAERGLSTFDQRHRFAGDFAYVGCRKGLVVLDLGLPDAGLASYADMVNRVQQFASINLPLGSTTLCASPTVVQPVGGFTDVHLLVFGL
jgi:hypothetical protein